VETNEHKTLSPFLVLLKVIRRFGAEKTLAKIQNSCKTKAFSFFSSFKFVPEPQQTLDIYKLLINLSAFKKYVA